MSSPAGLYPPPSPPFKIKNTVVCYILLATEWYITRSYTTPLSGGMAVGAGGQEGVKVGT
jgi:hypothetical protein